MSLCMNQIESPSKTGIKRLVMVCSLLPMLFCCGTKGPAPFKPDLKDYFTAEIRSADSSLQVMSLDYAATDTLHEKSTLNHELYPYLRDRGIVSFKLDSIAKQNAANSPVQKMEAAKMTEFLQSELQHLQKQIDSLNDRLAHADTTIPVGYMLRYKYVIRKKDGSILSDTCVYSFNTDLHMINWDGNNERMIENIVANRKAVHK